MDSRIHRRLASPATEERGRRREREIDSQACEHARGRVSHARACGGDSELGKLARTKEACKGITE